MATHRLDEQHTAGSLDSSAGGPRATRAVVLRAWLCQERGQRPPSGHSEADLLDELLSRKPGAAAFLGRETRIEWFRVTLDRRRLRTLRPIEGPSALSWRRVATDGTLASVARRIHESGFGVLADASGVDADTIADYRDALAAGESLAPLVVRTRRGRTAWHVADGNHRVTAAALRGIETGDYEPLDAYLAVTARSLLTRVTDRLRGVLWRHSRGADYCDPPGR